MSLEHLHPVTRTWFEECFDAPTRAQSSAWDAIARGESTLLMAPTGSGKTLAAFLFALDGLMCRSGQQRWVFEVEIHRKPNGRRCCETRLTY